MIVLVGCYKETAELTVFSLTIAIIVHVTSGGEHGPSVECFFYFGLWVNQ